MINSIVATCILLAAQTYSVPPAVLLGIMEVEGGRPGIQVLNKNGSYDLGVMQINTIHLENLSTLWNVPKSTAYRWIRDDACTNIGVAAWLLRGHVNRTKSLPLAIAHYHSRTPKYGYKYQRKVVTAMRRAGLVEKTTKK